MLPLVFVVVCRDSTNPVPAIEPREYTQSLFHWMAILVLGNIDAQEPFHCNLNYKEANDILPWAWNYGGCFPWEEIRRQEETASWC